MLIGVEKKHILDYERICALLYILIHVLDIVKKSNDLTSTHIVIISGT